MSNQFDENLGIKNNVTAGKNFDPIREQSCSCFSDGNNEYIQKNLEFNILGVMCYNSK